MQKVGIFEIPDFLTLDECAKLIKYIQTADKSTRNCYQGFHENPKIAKRLEQKLRKHQNFCEITSFHKKTFAKIHEKLTLTYYEPGQFLQKHKDTTYFDKTSVTMMTMLIYLNDDYEGGRTIFYPECGPEIEVHPKTGKAAVFDTNLTHIGEKIQAGRKWVISCKLQFYKN